MVLHWAIDINWLPWMSFLALHYEVLLLGEHGLEAQLVLIAHVTDLPGCRLIDIYKMCFELLRLYHPRQVFMMLGHNRWLMQLLLLQQLLLLNTLRHVLIDLVLVSVNWGTLASSTGHIKVISPSLRHTDARRTPILQTLYLLFNALIIRFKYTAFRCMFCGMDWMLLRRLYVHETLS